jgi:Hypothetical protein (DUF2513)
MNVPALSAAPVVASAADKPAFSLMIALKPQGRALMTRDMELIRKIITEIGLRKDTIPQVLEIPGTDDAILARHLEMLLDAGLIEGTKSSAYNAQFPTIMVTDLSWAGHEFANALGNENVWTKIKNSFSPDELRKMTWDTLKDVGVSLLTEWAKRRVGL